VETWKQVKEVLLNCSIIVGLHPDQATEAIVDFALQWSKPFAVIPCCVYHKEFPHRKGANGKPISKYEDFVSYLMAKNSQIMMTELDFEGKNKVLYWKP